MGLFSRTRRSPLPIGKAATQGRNRAAAGAEQAQDERPLGDAVNLPGAGKVPVPLSAAPAPPAPVMPQPRQVMQPIAQPDAARVVDRIKGQAIEPAAEPAAAAEVAETPVAVAAKKASAESLRERLQGVIPQPEPPRPAPETPLTERSAAQMRPVEEPPRAVRTPAKEKPMRKDKDADDVVRADGGREPATRRKSPARHMTGLAAGLINIIAVSALAAAGLFAAETGKLPWERAMQVAAPGELPKPVQKSEERVTTAALPPRVETPRVEQAPSPGLTLPPPQPGFAPTLDQPPPVIISAAPPIVEKAPTVARPRPLALETEHVKLFDQLIQPARETKLSVEDATRIRDANTALARGQYQDAQRLRETAQDPMTQKFINWMILRAGIGTPREMKSFLDSHPDWPDGRRIRQRMEEQAFIQGGGAREIKALFDKSEPQTGVGWAALASAHLAEGEEAKAREIVVRVWRDMQIPAMLETGFLDRFNKYLTDADHKWRFDRLTIDDIRWPGERAERVAFARRMLPRLSEPERRKAEARLLVFQRQASADPGATLLPKPPAEAKKPAQADKKAVAGKEKAEQDKARAERAKAEQAEREAQRRATAQAIEKAFADPAKIDWGLAFHRIQWLRRNNRQEESWRLLLKAPTDASKVVSPGEWWPERRLAAYDALKAGNAQLAYDLVKAPGDLPQNEEKDAAFLAGWIALRHLNDAKLAEPHFIRFEKSADGPLSRGKAGFWLARTYNALGQPEQARASLERATRNPDTFFGQLARMELDPRQTVFEVRPPKRPTEAEARAFNQHQSVLGAVMARRAGLDQAMVRSFLQHLRTTLEGESNQAMVAHLAEALDDTQFSIRIAKSAIARGLNLIYYGYPTHPMPAFKALRPPPEMALLLSVARQESEFNGTIRSGAGAAGLMQVMPITARHICRDYRFNCEIDRLGKDPA
ncbi:MAG: hypothetical protein RL291_1114, partial [Pseudomonadota bacterium]